MAGYIGYCGNNTALVRTAPGFMMYCDTTDVGITPHLMDSGRWQPRLTDYFLSKNLDGKTCVDVGANVGFYSILFGHKKARHVYSFEPLEDLCNLIEMSTAFNGKASGLTEYHIHQNGLSNVKASKYFRAHAGNKGGSRVVEDEAKATQKIEVRSLDSYDIPHVDVMKIDVEGMEGEVLLGAEETIRRSPSSILINMEWNPQYANREGWPKIWDHLGLKAYQLTGSNSLGLFDPNTLNTHAEIILTK